MAIALALLSMTCASGNDLVCKGRMSASASPARHLAVVSLVWTAVFAVPAVIAGPFTGAALLWGLVSGAAGIAANLLLLEAMRDGAAGACATIYRMNLVPATLLAALLLGEPLTATRALAVSAAVGAVALFGAGGAGLDRRSFLLAVAACVLRAGMALAYKRGQLDGGASSQLLEINGVVWFAGALLRGLPWRGGGRWSRGDVAFGVASGLLYSGNVLFLTLALARAPLMQVLPITQLGFVATTLAGCLLFGERITARSAAATGLAVACVALLARS